MSRLTSDAYTKLCAQCYIFGSANYFFEVWRSMDGLMTLQSAAATDNHKQQEHRVEKGHHNSCPGLQQVVGLQDYRSNSSNRRTIALY
ncbi:hypothetical protein EYF80_002608 [Liparis tanakae]|uniref:Uncharacterized protein n=1 Tax=Liparis tanakae TaxID=230148 RepID=A0A4Z2JBM6_9TELE|nr:hypothetical protein EYF80_002608 [Liparis tanakae]